MTDPSDLHVFAEVAITLAGLTGIVGAIQKRSTTGLSDREKLHIFNLLMVASYTVVLAFVPHWISQLPEGADHLWERAIWVLLLTHLIAWAVFIFGFSGGRVVPAYLGGLERAVSSTLAFLGIIAVALEVTIVTGYLTEYAAFLFEGVLVLFVCVGVFNFTALLLGSNHEAAN